jgi:hypothetical protein
LAVVVAVVQPSLAMVVAVAQAVYYKAHTLLRLKIHIVLLLVLVEQVGVFLAAQMWEQELAVQIQQHLV